MPLDYNTMFNKACNDEIVSRRAGNIGNGPAKIYGVALCEKDGVMLLGNKIERNQASMIVVGTDLLISIIFTFAVFRLRWYESLVEKDRQLLEPVVDDFSVYLPSIPINPEDYDNNPELLTAMMATHLESVLTQKFMQDQNMDEDEARDLSQVSSIHYGMRERVRHVSVLKKKMQYDKINAPIYEEEMWGIFTQVTRLKDKYYKEKMKLQESRICNAYITFRDIQARNKAL
jgi:hypothetical protein